MKSTTDRTIREILVAMAALWLAGGLPADAAESAILSGRVALGVQGILNPDAPQWTTARRLVISLGAQNMTRPRHPKPSVKQVMVQSVHNDRGWIAFRLEWRDSSEDRIPKTGRFSDVAAIMFPMEPRAPAAPMMGHRPGGRVQILQWRADWQEDVEKAGEITIRSLYPQAITDAPVDVVYHFEDSQAYSAGRTAGNIVSDARHFRSVQDLMAEGFGSLTPKHQQNALGKGIWNNGVWKIVMARPMGSPTDPDMAPLSENTRTFAGFAIWNGGAGERGARKAWAPWVSLVIE